MSEMKSTDQSSKLGFSGTLAKKFLFSEITPLLALVGILLGIETPSVHVRNPRI